MRGGRVRGVEGGDGFRLRFDFGRKRIHVRLRGGDFGVSGLRRGGVCSIGVEERLSCGSVSGVGRLEGGEIEGHEMNPKIAREEAADYLTGERVGTLWDAGEGVGCEGVDSSSSKAFFTTYSG